MNAKKILLDKALAMCNGSGEQLGERIGVSRSAVSKWRKGGTITEKHLAALAAVANVDGELVVQALAEQASDRKERAVWQSVLDRLSPAVATVGATTLCALGLLGNGANTALSAAERGAMYLM